MNLVDFRHAAEAVRVTINQWIEQRTRQKIRDFIPSGGLGAETRLVLVNAVYFKGTWLRQFRSAATRDEPFHLEVGGTVQVPLMHQREEIQYVQAVDYQAVDLVYRGGDLSMLVLLPDRKGELRDLEKTLSAEMLYDCVSRMDIRKVKLFLHGSRPLGEPSTRATSSPRSACCSRSAPLRPISPGSTATSRRRRILYSSPASFTRR